jgi:hypothetical protein
VQTGTQQTRDGFLFAPIYLEFVGCKQETVRLCENYLWKKYPHLNLFIGCILGTGDLIGIMFKLFSPLIGASPLFGVLFTQSAVPPV